jgi:uncharacterized protein (TIGR03437 family)
MSTKGRFRVFPVSFASPKKVLLALASALLISAAAADSRAATITVAAGGSFQSALDAAQPGDTIVLEAGASFVGPFTLPVKSGDAFITVQSSRLDALPGAGRRVSPSDAAAMPKLLTPGAGQAALRTAPGAHHYRFVGVEFAPTDASALVYNLVALGDTGAAQDTPAEVPHDLEFDRCYLHALPSQELRRGFMLNSAETTVRGCYVSGFKAKGTDAQAVAGWNGPGPFHLLNNYLEASGENVMFGGSDPSIPNLVPSDIEVRGNYLTKPLSWRGAWTVKNLFELKNARRVVVDGNLMENNWGDAQSGEAILFTVRDQEGTAPWSVVEDVTFTNNVVRHVGGGVNVLGNDYYYPSQQTKRVTVRNNLFDDVNGPLYNGRGEFLLVSQRAADLTFDHNTVLQTGGVVVASEGPHSGFVFTNNVAQHNQYGIYGDGTGSGNQTLGFYFPLGVVSRDVIVGANPANYPADDFYPSALQDVGFVDLAGGDYRLRADSPYRGRATDGKDVGCDFDALAAAQSGSSPSPTPTPAPTPNATPTPAPTPTATPAPTATPTPTPSDLSPWLHQDVGSVGLSGSAARAAGVITVKAAGADIWGNADGFHFVYQPLNGDGEIVMRVAGFQSANSYAKVGLMIRESLAAGASHVLVSETPSSPAEVVFRSAAGGPTAYGGGAASGASWLKLARRGNDFSAYLSADGVNWSLLTMKTVPMAATAYAGLAVTNHDTGSLCTALFDGLSLTAAQQPTPTSLPLVSQALANASALASATAATESQIRDLAAAVDQARSAFAAESANFAPAAQIDLSLRCAFYFARAAAALAAAGAPTAAVQSRLSVAAARLQQARDLMQPAGASSPSATSAVAAGVGIGSADARSGASFAPLLAAASLGTISAQTATSPLSARAETAGSTSLPFELAGASVSVGGVAASLVYVSPSRIDFVVPAGLAPGDAEVIVTSEEGYVSRGTVAVAQVAPGLFTASGDGVGQALALGAWDYTPGPFDVTATHYYGADNAARVMIYATGLRGAADTDAGNDVRQAGGGVLANFAESVSVQARTSDGRVFQLPVEFAGAAGGFAGIDQLTVRLVPELKGAGAVELTVAVGGQASNRATISVR